MSRFIFLCLALLNSGFLVARASVLTQITIVMDEPIAVKAVLEPFAYIPLYTYATARLDTNRQALLSFETDGPLFAELKIKNEVGRILYRVPIYVEPGTQLKVTLQKGEHEVQDHPRFQGLLHMENEGLQELSSYFSYLRSGTDPVALKRQLEEILKKSTYTSNFKKQVKTVTDLIIQEKRLSDVENNPKAYKRALQDLLYELKKERSWLSVFQWPSSLDNILSRCENAGLIKKSSDGFAGRLAYIGNNETRERYGIYYLSRLVHGAHWFDNPPTESIANVRSYLTTERAKKDLEIVIEDMRWIEREWAHMRVQTAPDFTFEDVNGKAVTLSSFKGKFVLLDIWNIYCGSCMRQVPYLQRLEPELQKMGIEVIGVSCDSQNIKDKWKATVIDKKMAGVQVIMDNGRYSKFMTDYHVPGFPTFCLIDKEGYVINPSIGLYPENPAFMEYIKQKIGK